MKCAVSRQPLVFQNGGSKTCCITAQVLPEKTNSMMDHPSQTPSKQVDLHCRLINGMQRAVWKAGNQSEIGSTL